MAIFISGGIYEKRYFNTASKKGILATAIWIPILVRCIQLMPKNSYRIIEIKYAIKNIIMRKVKCSFSVFDKNG